MPRQFIKRLTPSPDTIRSHRSLRCLGKILHDPNLWHLNRHSVSLACFIGLFVAFIPFPGQMVLAALLAIWLHANFTLSVMLVWTSNPITIPPLFFIAYTIGNRLMGSPEKPVDFELSVNWLMTHLAAIWQPLLLGSLICGFVLGGLAYLSVRMFWRFHAIQRWQRRAAIRRGTP